MQLNQEQIKEIIPHRDPFLLIDEIVECEPGKSVVAIKHIREDDFWFRGHFPGHPVVPGVLMLEMLAQAGACAMLMLPENKGKLGFFGGVKDAKFRRQVVPGDVLRLEVEIVKTRGPVGFGKGLASVVKAAGSPCPAEGSSDSEDARSLTAERAVSAEISFALK